MKKRRMISAGLLAFLMLLCFASCGKREETETESGYLLTEDGEVVPDTVLTIGGSPVSFAEYRYFYKNYVDEYSGGDRTVFTEYPEYADFVREDTLRDLKLRYAVFLLSEELGIRADDAWIRESIETGKEGFSSEEEFYRGMRDYYLDDALFYKAFEQLALQQALYDGLYGENGRELFSEEAFLRYVQENFLRAKQIFIRFDTGEEMDITEARVRSVLRQALEGEDFDRLVSLYSDDAAMPEYGYYFRPQDAEAYFTNTVASLAEGQLSDVVKSSMGFHVILRLPVSEADMEKIKTLVYEGLYSDRLTEKTESLTMEFGDWYEKITPQNLY